MKGYNKSEQCVILKVTADKSSNKTVYSWLKLKLNLKCSKASQSRTHKLLRTHTYMHIHKFAYLAALLCTHSFALHARFDYFALLCIVAHF